MSAMPALMKDLEGSMQGKHASYHERTLFRILDLFAHDPAAYNEDHVAVFDEVILRLAAEIEHRARTDLAERLADIPNAPRKTLRRLAHDSIHVARPVLTRSTRLTDQDLISVAMTRGRDHMLAISERGEVAAPVAEVLVLHGDRVVVNAIAGNNGARFSPDVFAKLLDKAREDEFLVNTLRTRSDFPPEHLTTLVEIAKETARQRLARMVGVMDEDAVETALDRSASSVANAIGAGAGAGVRDFKTAVKTVADKLTAGTLGEADISAFADAKQFEETVCGLAALAAVSVPVLTRMFATREQDMLLVIGRTLNFEWKTMQKLMLLMTGPRPSEQSLRQASENYSKLSQQTSERVLRFMQMREVAKLKAAPRPTA